MKTCFACMLHLLLGTAFIVFAVVLTFRRVAFWRSGVSTTGVILGHEAHYSEEGVGYAPVIGFKDSEGAHRQFVSSLGSFPKCLVVGASVKVLYSQSNPSMAYIQSFWHIWIEPIFFGVLGITALVVSSWL